MALGSREAKSKSRRPNVYVDSSTQGETVEIVAVGPDGGAVPVSLATDTDVIGGTKDAGDAYAPTRTFVSSADLTTAADASPAASASEKIVVVDILAAAAVAMRLDFLEETSGTVLFAIYLAANGTVQFTPRGLLQVPTAVKKLRVQASAAGAVRVMTLTRSAA